MAVRTGCMGSCLFVLILFILMVIPTFSTPRSAKWVRDESFDDTFPLNTNVADVPSELLTTEDKLQCARECAEEEWCNSFFYNKASRGCLLDRMVYKELSAVTGVQGWHYFRMILDKCPSDENYVIDRLSATCYRPTEDQLYWADARDSCDAEGEMFVVLESEEKATFLMNYLKINRGNNAQLVTYHIGASRPNGYVPFPQSGPDFVWIDGDPVDMNATKRFWLPSKPDFASGKSVVCMRGVNMYGWSEGKPDRRLCYVCQLSF